MGSKTALVLRHRLQVFTSSHTDQCTGTSAATSHSKTPAQGFPMNCSEVYRWTTWSVQHVSWNWNCSTWEPIPKPKTSQDMTFNTNAIPFTYSHAVAKTPTTCGECEYHHILFETGGLHPHMLHLSPPIPVNIIPPTIILVNARRWAKLPILIVI